jgi:hypothetical protein
VLHSAYNQQLGAGIKLYALTGGGFILMIPVFSPTSRIFSMKAAGSLNSSHDGSKTGASGGGTKSDFPLHTALAILQPPCSKTSCNAS